MQSTLKELNPDILLCAHFNQLVHPVIYEIPKYASVNMHPSLLPALKGVDPSFYSLLENNTTSGATLHHLDQNFDTGAIIAQSEVIIEENDSVFSLNLKLFEAGTELIFQYLDTQEDIQTLKKTVHSSSQYDSWPTKTQIKVFKDANKSLISWKDIHRLIQFGSI